MYAKQELVYKYVYKKYKAFIDIKFAPAITNNRIQLLLSFAFFLCPQWAISDNSVNGGSKARETGVLNTYRHTYQQTNTSKRFPVGILGMKYAKRSR